MKSGCVDATNLNHAITFKTYAEAEEKLISIKKTWHNAYIDYSKSKILKRFTELYEMEERLEDE